MIRPSSCAKADETPLQLAVHGGQPYAATEGLQSGLLGFGLSEPQFSHLDDVTNTLCSISCALLWAVTVRAGRNPEIQCL